MSVPLPLPRFVIAKRLRSGATAYYWTCPTHYRRLGCTIANEPLGPDYAAACGPDGAGGKAAALNAAFDEWNAVRVGNASTQVAASRFGTVDWLFRTYKASEAYLGRVSTRSRGDYEFVMSLITELPTKTGDRVGDRPIKAITPRSADTIYRRIVDGGRGERYRQGEKAVAIAKKAWRTIRRLYPDLFDAAVPNPWEGVTLARRQRTIKPAVTRDDVYTFAWGAIEAGEPEAAAAAVICFEWLQRPENVLAGYVQWSNYRSEAMPTAIRIEHHKTGEAVWHPLEETIEGERTAFYADAEAVLARVPRRGVPMILRQPKGGGPAQPYTVFQMGRIVRRLRADLGLPDIFTLDACRHGGMTELEEAGLTDGQGRALSAHRSQAAYQRYAKRTMNRALSATRKRHAYRVAGA